MKPINPNVKKMTDLELLAYKPFNPLIDAEVDRRKKSIKLNVLSLVKS